MTGIPDIDQESWETNSVAAVGIDQGVFDM